MSVLVCSLSSLKFLMLKVRLILSSDREFNRRVTIWGVWTVHLNSSHNLLSAPLWNSASILDNFFLQRPGKMSKASKELPCPLEFSLKATRRTFNQIKLFRVEQRKSRLKKKLLRWQVAQSYLIEGKQNFYILKKEDVDYNLEPIAGKFGLKIFAAVYILDVNWRIPSSANAWSALDM